MSETGSGMRDGSSPRHSREVVVEGSSGDGVRGRRLALHAPAVVTGVRAGDEEAVDGDGAQRLLTGAVQDEGRLDGEHAQVVFVPGEQVPVDGVLPQVLDEAHPAFVQLACNTNRTQGTSDVVTLVTITITITNQNTNRAPNDLQFARL
ncbi:MAG: hypothetical protein KAG66_03785 [Methylococcales bacterium]|nr:hypothetical protein [Methylococcales bacterium]